MKAWVLASGIHRGQGALGGRSCLVSEEIEGTGMDRLKTKYEVSVVPDIWKSPARLEAALQGAQALFVRNQTQVTESLLARARTNGEWKGELRAF